MNKIAACILMLFVVLNANGQRQEWVVAQDGSGQFKTVQEAFDAVPTGNKDTIYIHVKKGVYKERLVLDTRKDFVKLVGEDAKLTVLTFDNHAGKILANGDTVNTWTSASFFIYANNFSAEHITFQNDAGFTAGQAVAVDAFGDKLFFRNCRFIGFQDVLFCSGSGARQYYRDCYIEGTTDFIFGPATAMFDNCTLYSKKKSHVTAASTPREVPFGLVFFNCRLLANDTLKGVSLGRPWQPFASVTYIHCYLGQHIAPQGWSDWGRPANQQTARYAEYKNYGPGSDPGKRAGWIKQLNEKEISAFTLKNIFGKWQPGEEPVMN